jgi:hypothetical protein
MISDRLGELIEAWCENRMDENQRVDLNRILRESSEARQRFFDAAKWHGLLQVAAQQMALEDSVPLATQPIAETQHNPTASWIVRNAAVWLIGMVSGIVLCATAVWSYNSQTTPAAWIVIEELQNGDFEDAIGAIPSGFPKQSGVWSGDEAVVVQGREAGDRRGGNRLQFIATGRDSNQPEAKSIACDLFQWLTIEKLPIPGGQKQEMILELSADFLDDRPRNTQPSVTFFCQIYLFRGDPESIRSRWPLGIADAVSSGSGQVTTLGDSGRRTVTARCLVCEPADFAVVHLAARPNLRGPMPADLFVDSVRLDGKSLTILPARTQRSH